MQGKVGAEPILLVALHLQACKVKESGWCLRALLLLNVCYGEGQVSDGRQSGFSFLPGAESPFSLLHQGCEGGVPIYGGEHPVGDRNKVLNFSLSVDNKGQGGSLYTSHAEHLLS